MNTQLVTQASTEVDVSQPLTVEALKAIMPTRQKGNITPEFVNSLNNIAIDPEFRENFRENIIGYVDVLNDPNTSLKGYIRAVKYVSFKIMGFTNQDCWVRTFPERFQRLVDAGKPEAYVRSLVCAYNKGKLVQQILQQSMTPTWVLNADKFQEAINQLAHLMVFSKSEKVQSDSAAHLLTHLKRPEAAKLEVDVTVSGSDVIGEMRREVLRLSEAQADAIRSRSMTAQEIAESDVVEGELVEGDFA